MTARAEMVEVDDSTFDQEVLGSDVPVLVDFGARWCPPCRVLKPMLARMAVEYGGQVKVVTVDTDDSPQTAERYGIRGVPTLIVFRNGEKTDHHVGVLPREKLLALVTG